MAETIRDGRWHWYDVDNDLRTQGELDKVCIDPLSVNAHGCGGVTKMGTNFYFSWILNTFLLLSMSVEELTLVDAFAKVVEYRPFCRYVDDNGMLTFEWDKNDPSGRSVELQSEGKRELTAIQ